MGDGKENYKLSISEKVIYTTKVKRNIENDQIGQKNRKMRTDNNTLKFQKISNYLAQRH